MSNLLLFFSIVCFGTYHSLLVMEEQISTFTKNIDQLLKKGAYSAIYYVNKEGDDAIVSQAFPQTIATNYFARVGESNTKQVSLFLNALLGKNIIKKENHLMKYFSTPYQIDRCKHVINCHSVSEDNIPNGYLCFSLESRMFATFDTPIVKNDQYDHSTIILRHLDHELKEKDISMPYGFLVNSFFVASQYLVIGSHVLESQQSTKKINNKYRIDIFDVAAFIKNESVTSDNLNGDLEYYLGIDIEDTNTNTNPEDSDSLFTLESVHDNILFLCNEITKQFINLDFLNHAENTKQPENILIHYAFQKPKYLEIFSIFDENIISPFTKIYNLTIDKKIPVIRYENKHAQFVEVQQTCPIILTTNFFIKVEQKSAQDIYNYTEDQRLEEIDFCFDPDRFITVVDEDALRLFMNTFLGNIETNQSDLRVYYRVQENIDPQVDTVIKCCQYAKEAFGVPSSKTYRCFSLESRLLATYSSAFSPSCPEPYDERYQILLQHLDNKEKKYTIKTNEDLTIKSIFLKESYLIVGSSSHRYSDKKSQYHIDIYDATKFSKNSEMLTSSDTHNSVDYFLGIDVEIDAQYTAETQENIKFKHVPCKLLTIKDGCCVLLLKEKEETEHYLYIPFLDEKEEKRNIHGYSITYRKNPIPESIPQSISKSIPESKSLTQNNKPHWFKKHCIPIGTVGTIVFALLLYGYHNKKCASLFN